MANESYWTYQSSQSTQEYGELPEGVFKGTEAQWHSLSPGMRREIVRQAKRAKPAPSFLDISTVSEYGLTQKLSSCIRCF